MFFFLVVFIFGEKARLHYVNVKKPKKTSAAVTGCIDLVSLQFCAKLMDDTQYLWPVSTDETRYNSRSVWIFIICYRVGRHSYCGYIECLFIDIIINRRGGTLEGKKNYLYCRVKKKKHHVSRQFVLFCCSSTSNFINSNFSRSQSKGRRG